MTHLLGSLLRLQEATKGLPRAFMRPDKPESLLLVEKLQAGALDPRKPQEQTLEALRKRLQRFYAGQEEKPPSQRELRNAAWILWNGSPQGAEIPGLMEAVAAKAERAPRLIRPMIEAWLRDFRPNSPTIERGGVVIRRLLSRGADPALEPWREAQRRMAMFDATDGPARIASTLLAGPEPVGEILGATGLDDQFRAAGGYMREVLRALLARLPAALRGTAGAETLARAEDLLAPEGTLRFGQELRGEVGRGLLGAWLGGGPPPDAVLRDRVRDLLLRHLGDPRTRPANWMPVGEDATALMRRWLAEVSLDAFFALIDAHALDHQWRHRKAFWSAYLDRGAIADAWLALGKQVRAEARTLKDLRGAYGRLEGSGVAGNQSVLLMRIGRLVLCEWSHNGKLRAWPADWANAPALHRSEYWGPDLRKAQGLAFPPNPSNGKGGAADGFGLAHHGAADGLWQGSAAELIARQTGVRITAADWIPS